MLSTRVVWKARSFCSFNVNALSLGGFGTSMIDKFGLPLFSTYGCRKMLRVYIGLVKAEESVICSMKQDVKIKIQYHKKLQTTLANRVLDN